MVLKDFLEIVEYGDFDICVNSDKGLKTIFKINSETPIKYLSNELLNCKIVSVYINDEHEDLDLFTIEIELGGNK